MLRQFRVVSLLLWYLPVFIIQVISAQITFKALNPWYENLLKPSWTPPGWVFGPVWTGLYLLITLSVWLIYRSITSKKERFAAFSLFFIQLIVNGLWTVFFFGYQNPGGALIDVLVLIPLVFITMFYFYLIRPLAGILFLPYFLWLLFAAALNGAIWHLN